jgi:hypothetical protein
MFRKINEAMSSTNSLLSEINGYTMLKNIGLLTNQMLTDAIREIVANAIIEIANEMSSLNSDSDFNKYLSAQVALFEIYKMAHDPNLSNHVGSIWGAIEYDRARSQLTKIGEEKRNLIIGWINSRPELKQKREEYSKYVKY